MVCVPFVYSPFIRSILRDLHNFYPDVLNPLSAKFPYGESDDPGIHIQLGKNPGPAVLDLFSQMGKEITSMGVNQLFVTACAQRIISWLCASASSALKGM